MGEAASQMGGPLPAALATGRATLAGPQTGGYVSFGLSGYNNAVFDLTDAIVYAIEMPMDFRIEAIAWSCRTEGADGSSFQVAQATSLLWAGAEIDILSADVAASTGGNEVLVAAGSSQTLVAAARDVARGDFLMIAYTSDADSTVLDLNVQILGFAKGHINVDPADD